MRPNQGVVLEQSPVAGAHVKENRLIHLIINAHNPEKVVFPNLQNAAYRQTLQTLTSRGFKIGHIEYARLNFIIWYWILNMTEKISFQGAY